MVAKHKINSDIGIISVFEKSVIVAGNTLYFYDKNIIKQGSILSEIIRQAYNEGKNSMKRDLKKFT